MPPVASRRSSFVWPRLQREPTCRKTAVRFARAHSSCYVPVGLNGKKLLRRLTAQQGFGAADVFAYQPTRQVEPLARKRAGLRCNCVRRLQKRLDLIRRLMRGLFSLVVRKSEHPVKLISRHFHEMACHFSCGFKYLLNPFPISLCQVDARPRGTSTRVRCSARHPSGDIRHRLGCILSALRCSSLLVASFFAAGIGHNYNLPDLDLLCDPDLLFVFVERRGAVNTR